MNAEEPKGRQLGRGLSALFGEDKEDYSTLDAASVEKCPNRVPAPEPVPAEAHLRRGGNRFPGRLDPRAWRVAADSRAPRPE